MRKLLLLSVVFLFTGCSTVNKSVIASPINISAESKINADIKVGEKITGTAKSTLLMGFIVLTGPDKFADGVFGSLLTNPFDPTPSIKAAAAYNAVSRSGADVIVNPQYRVKINRAFMITMVEVTVTGYNGKIMGFN